jgi:ADP-ribosylglycohydrolase
MVLASFTADAHALGAHWIYDTQRIAREIGRVETLLKPLPDSFHKNREAGGFTHYGDQTAVLLESLADRSGFHLDDFWHRWQDLFAGYDGYVDQATKATLRNIEDGKGPEDCGSFSDELAGAARIAPLVSFYAENPETLEEAVTAQTRMTHNNPIVVQCGLFFARTARGVLAGASPVASMEKEADGFPGSPVSEWVQKGIRSRDEESVEAILRFGQTCHAEQAFPSAVHIIARHEDNLKEALIQSVMAGGDSAGRGLLIGMVLGAHLGEDAVPRDWLDGLIKGEAIGKALDRLS